MSSLAHTAPVDPETHRTLRGMLSDAQQDDSQVSYYCHLDRLLGMYGDPVQPDAG